MLNQCGLCSTLNSSIVKFQFQCHVTHLSVVKREVAACGLAQVGAQHALQRHLIAEHEGIADKLTSFLQPRWHAAKPPHGFRSRCVGPDLGGPHWLPRGDGGRGDNDVATAEACPRQVEHIAAAHVKPAFVEHASGRCAERTLGGVPRKYVRLVERLARVQVLVVLELERGLRLGDLLGGELGVRLWSAVGICTRSPARCAAYSALRRAY